MVYPLSPLFDYLQNHLIKVIEQEVSPELSIPVKRSSDVDNTVELTQ